MGSRERAEESVMEGNGKKSAPLCNNVLSEGEVDTSGAARVVIDGRELKEKSYHRYLSVVYYWFNLLQKSNLKLFTHPGSGDVDGGLVSHEGEELEKKNNSYYSYAIFAIDEFNCLRKDMKLRLVELHKVNTAYWGGLNLYMTFSAVDELSGNTCIYQAAVVPLIKGRKVLGLFRDCSKDKILAILSITGAEEDLEANKRQCYGEPVKSDYGVELSECRDLKHFTSLGIAT